MKLVNKLAMAAGLAMLTAASSCESDATIATANLTKAADNFEVSRRIVFINTMTDEYLLTIEGLCSMELNTGGTAFNVICKTGRSEYKRHTLVLAATTTAVVEQTEAVHASAYHYRVIFKPQSVLPDIDFRGSADELTTNSSEANQ